MNKRIENSFVFDLLRWFCPSQLYEEIEGDLIQKFERDVKRFSQASDTSKVSDTYALKKAKRKLLWNMIRFFRPGIILRNKFKVNFINTMLFTNYLKVAFRNLWRSKGYSFITIGGLAIGIACSLVIFLFVHGEWSHDKGFSNADRTYRIGISFFNIGKFASAPEALLDVLPKEFGGIETATRINQDKNVPIKIDDQTLIEPIVYHTDSAYFKIFDYTFISGNAERALSGANDAILTDDVAKKFFGDTDVIGKTFEVGKTHEVYTITGVVKNLNFNSHLKSQLWLSNQNKLTKSPVWSSAAFYSYVLLKENNSEADLNNALDLLFEHHVYPESGKPMGFATLEDYRKNDMAIKFYVHNLKDIYLHSKLNFELSPGGNETNIYIFSAISLFILILAAVNFVNLTTARATRRAKEVGIRKALGTLRSKLVGQYLLESVTTSILSMLVALLLAEVFLRIFESVTGTPLLTTIWQTPYTVGMFILFSLLVGVLSGIYPAFYLTSFIPVKVLKGTIETGGASFRSFLVVFQFTISILLISCSLVVQNQLHFMATKYLGFDQQNVLTIDRMDLLKDSPDAFRNELASLPGVTASSFHTGEPGSNRVMTFSTYQTPKMDHPASIFTYSADENFLSLNSMRLKAGRDFNKELASDSSAIILNEAAVAALDLGENAIGAVINENQKVIGVVSNFHWESLRNEIAPLAIVMGKDRWELGFKLEAKAIPAFLVSAEQKWKQLVPDEPFRYHFLDDNFGELLSKEKIFSKTITVFTILAILISCLGLYGLSAFTVEQRTKEIGIRKVLGASAYQIVGLLNKKFTLLVIIALVISVPLSIYLLQQWLDGFAYKVELNVGLFLITGLISILIAWIAVSYHSLKAANINPTDTLKYE
jgi:putative ABC transport system permease protein